MILTDKQILNSIENKEIIIEPFDRNCLGTNSYDVHLGKYLATYTNEVLDAKKHNTIQELEIGEEGFVIQPGTLYLGVTQEYTETHNSVPFLEGNMQACLSANLFTSESMAKLKIIITKRKMRSTTSAP